MVITGTTKIYLMLADPIAQVRTPELLNSWLQAQAIDAVMVPLHVAPSHLEAVWAGLRGMANLGGLVVSLPHKAAIMALADEVRESAFRIGTANAVRREPDGRLVVDNFDGRGFLTGLRAQGHEPAGARVLLVGCGGAGTAIAHTLVEAGAAGLTLVDLDQARAGRLLERVSPHHPACRVRVGAAGPGGAADPCGHDMVVNATPMGLRPEDPLPIDADRLAPATLVADIIMKPEVTPLLATARSRGCPVHPGRHMLERQLGLLTEFFGLE